MSDSVFNEDFKIPDRLVGLVIGRGGEQIKKLQADSGCKIRIASESDGTDERSCTLTGSQHTINEAKRMIGEVVTRGLNRDNTGNNGNNGGYRNFNNGGGYQRNNNGGGNGNGFGRRY